MEHPIQGLMKTAMTSIKEMVDVNTVVGDPVETQDGSVIVPVSRVAFGFGAGGAEYGGQGGGGDGDGSDGGLPFGGGSGAGISVNPVGFLVVGQGNVRFLSIEAGGATFDRIIDAAPALIERLAGTFKRGGDAGKGEGYRV